jgi:4-amino-4-deoxy-L-arabinose transferase-like glycosyltransferase
MGVGREDHACPGPASRPAIVLAVAIVLLGLGLRLYAAHEVNRSQPDTRARLSADEPGYDNLARGLLNGEGLTWPGRVPLYPVWLAGLHLVTGYSYASAIYIQSFVGALAVWLTFLLGRDRFGEVAGLLAALGAAVHLPLIRESTRFLSELLFTPAILLVAIAVCRALDAPTTRRFAWTGVWIGVANLIRPTLVGFAPFAAVAILHAGGRRAVRHAAAIVAVSLFVVTPWIVRNYLKYDALYPLATSNAVLWQGSPEYFHLIRDRNYTHLDVWNKVLYGPGAEGQAPGTISGDRYWTRRALQSIAAEPLVYLRFCTQKTVTYWIGDPNADWNDTYVFNYRALRHVGHSRAAALQLMAWRAFPLLAFGALIALGRDRRRVTGIVLLIGYCALLHALTHAEVRLSEPLHPLLLVITAGAVLQGLRAHIPGPPCTLAGPRARPLHRGEPRRRSTVTGR